MAVELSEWLVVDAHERLYHLGTQALTNVELLTLVIGTGATRNAAEIAQKLYGEYGGLLGIARLGLADLQDLHGIGLSKAMQLKSAIELGGRIRSEQIGLRPLIRTPAEAAAMLLPDMGPLEQEEVRTMLLDARSRHITTKMIYKGSLNSCNMRVGEVFREAIRHNAASIILAHNHPSNDVSPSSNDIYVTKELIRAGKLLDIEVVDHLVLGQNAFVSLKERGLGFE